MTHQHAVPGLTSVPIPKSQTNTPTTTLENKTPKPEDTKASNDSTAEKQDLVISEFEKSFLCLEVAIREFSEIQAATKKQSKNAGDFHQQHIDKVTNEKDDLEKGCIQMEERYKKVKEDNDPLAEEIAKLKKQLAIDDKQYYNMVESQKLIEHLTIENNQLKEAREAAIKQLKAQPIMQDMINKLVKEKKKREEKYRNSTTEMEAQNKQLQKHAEDLANEVQMLRKENAESQKEISKAGQNGATLDMAKLLKRYYEIEEQFGQMKRDIKQDMKNTLAKKEKKMFQQVQEHILQNDKRTQEALMDTEKRVQEANMVNMKQVQEALAECENMMQKNVDTQLEATKDYFQKQVEGRLAENEKRFQERLDINEPLKEVPDNLIEISGAFNGAYVYVERNRIATFEAS
ncbi:hypothetical protein BZA77DRAFT_353458 [Pyronema omphalodes]|nr:hypothetical protein BZA77DRAFT_353458 [Pyronema omphalodes]